MSDKAKSALAAVKAKKSAVTIVEDDELAGLPQSTRDEMSAGRAALEKHSAGNPRARGKTIDHEPAATETKEPVATETKEPAVVETEEPATPVFRTVIQDAIPALPLIDNLEGLLSTDGEDDGSE